MSQQQLDPSDPAALGLEEGADPTDPSGSGDWAFDPFHWLSEPVHGDIQTASVENIFSPEEGGWNRLALVFESAFDGPGMPRGVHLVIAGIEIMLLAQMEGAEEAIEGAEGFVEPPGVPEGGNGEVHPE